MSACPFGQRNDISPRRLRLVRSTTGFVSSAGTRRCQRLWRETLAPRTEELPALAMAEKRLGLSTTVDARPMEAVVALRYPEAVSQADNLPTTLREGGLSYCILTEGDAEQP